MYILNPRLAADIFDGEYIIANLDNGLYYSIQGLGVSLVQALPFTDQKQTINLLSIAFPEKTAEIEKELEVFFSELLKEEIITQDQSANSPLNSVCIPPNEYNPSRLNRYADMQDLLLLDPIHDVNEEGWTVQKENK